MDKVVSYLCRRWWLVLFNILFGIWTITIWYDVLFGEEEPQEIEIIMKEEPWVS